MSKAIRYYSSKTGHTAKMANAIGDAIGVKAETVAVPLSEPVDKLILGASVYAYGIDNSVKEFLKENKDKIGEVYLFSQAALIKGSYKQTSKVCKDLGIKISRNQFWCPGEFHGVKAGRPNDKDIADAIKWAEKL